LVLWLAAVPGTVWMALAVHFDLPWPRWRTPLALLLVLGSLALMTLLPLLPAALSWSALFGGVVWWWLSIEPRGDRDWELGVARAPRVSIDGDKVLIRGFRDFDYRPDGAPVLRYDDRSFDLSRVESLDYFLSHWSGPAIAHTMVSVGFGDDRYLCISVEVRKERGQRYSSLKGFFRQFELIYVIGEERDLVRLRTAIRREEVYLYRVRIPPERIRRFLLECLRRAESLAARPEWYNALTSNCTTNLFAHVEDPPRGLDALKILFNGYSDRYIYRRGAFADHLSFEELKRRSLIRGASSCEGSGPEFSRRLRAGLVEPEREVSPRR
jgi:hypothetical protein